MSGGPRDVLDVGCGTGIAARLFAARNVRVLGVEPDERMAAVARRHGVPVELARFETWEPAGRRFDLVISAQAWHWIDPRVGARKVVDVLRPGGRVGVFWNCVVLEAATRAVLGEVYRQIAPRLDEHAMLLGNFDEQRIALATSAFDDTTLLRSVETRTFVWERRYRRDEWLDLLPTHSDHRTLPADQLDRLLGAVGEALDGLGGSFPVVYQVRLVSATRS
jgi:SAM-dependent methyltransferase